MAQTQAQWFDKIKKFVPAWWFEKQKYNVAIFQAIAAVFAQIDQDAFDQWDTTFLLNSIDPWLSVFGDERGIAKLPNESDQDYQLRIQRITSQTDIVNIKKVVDSLLIVPGCIIKEAPTDSVYANRKCFANRSQYVSAWLENYFVIIVPKQVHSPYSFASRSVYANRLNFFGSSEAPTNEYASIIAVVNYMKAFGVMYRIVESQQNVLV